MLLLTQVPRHRRFSDIIDSAKFCDQVKEDKSRFTLYLSTINMETNNKVNICNNNFMLHVFNNVSNPY